MGKDTIILLHGWGGSKKSLEPLAHELENQFRVLNLELPGFGETKQPPNIWGVKDYAKYVVEQAQKQGSQNFYLFGHSFGGQIAVQITLDYPEKIKKLILCSAAVIRKRTGLTLLKIKIAKLFKDTPLAPVASLFVRNSSYKKASPHMKKIMSKILQEDLTSKLSEIKCPTLILWGEKDSITPLPRAYLIHKKIPHSKLKVFKDLKHGLPLVAPDLIAWEIEKWK